MNEEIRTIDSPEQMQKCFSCTAPNCYNCLGGGKPKKAKTTANSKAVLGRTEKVKIMADSEAVLGRPTEYDFDKLWEMYDLFVELKNEGFSDRQVAELMHMKSCTLQKRMQKFKKLCKEMGLESLLVLPQRRVGKPEVWTREKLEEFCGVVDDLSATGLTRGEIALCLGITPITIYHRQKKYERMIGEGE